MCKIVSKAYEHYRKQSPAHNRHLTMLSCLESFQRSVRICSATYPSNADHPPSLLDPACYSVQLTTTPYLQLVFTDFLLCRKEYLPLMMGGSLVVGIGPLLYLVNAPLKRWVGLGSLTRNGSLSNLTLHWETTSFLHTLVSARGNVSAV